LGDKIAEGGSQTESSKGLGRLCGERVWSRERCLESRQAIWIRVRKKKKIWRAGAKAAEQLEGTLQGKEREVKGRVYFDLEFKIGPPKITH